MFVQQLWRYPVKSMGGTEVQELRFQKGRVHADRLWALRDVDKGVTGSARRISALLLCSARYVTEPTKDAGPGNVPNVIITFADGTEMESSDPGIHAALSDVAGREVRLESLPDAKDTSQHKVSIRNSLRNYSGAQMRADLGLGANDKLPDSTKVSSLKEMLTLARYSTPPGTFVDLSPVHLLTTSSVQSLAPQGLTYDPRRFRPNVIVESPELAGFPEADWIGGEVSVGGTTLKVTGPTVRCVVPTRPQAGGVELDKQVSRQLATLTDRFLGIYADVKSPGVVRVGDEVAVAPPRVPGAIEKALISASLSARRGSQRIAEATILKERTKR